MTPCPYCHREDCPDREECARLLDKIRRQDKAGFQWFTRDLPIKRETRNA